MATFYLDFTSGSDTARTALTSCVASNPSGTVTRINKTAHGLVTGAVVDLTLFTTWLNTRWQITVVDADNFDLDGAVWQTTADTNGTVTPRGGSSWSDAWKTISSGATGARIQAGDVVRIAKTEDETSMAQSASFTNASNTVTLTTAVTKKIEDAISGWTASTNVTASTNSSRKLGATSQNLAFAAGFTTGKAAYKAIAGGGTQDFSAYNKISFWFFSSATASASAYSIRLCSDTTGDTAVDTLNLPAIPVANVWQAIVIDKGSALGSSIQSVSIVANSDPGTANIRINNIFACGDLHLQSLIGKSGDVNYSLQSIDGTTLKIDSNNTTAQGQGYSGTTESVTIYRRNMALTTPGSGNISIVNTSGSGTGGYIEFSGGWDTGSTTQNGFTWLDGQCFSGTGFTFASNSFIKINNIGFCRYSTATSAANSQMCTIENCRFINSNTAFSGSTFYRGIISDCLFYNNSSVFQLINGANVLVKNSQIRNSSAFGATISGGVRFRGCTFANNASGSVTLAEGGEYGTGAALFSNCLFSDTTEFGFTASRKSFAWSFDHDQTEGSYWGFTEGATVNWQTGTVHDSEPGAWKTAITSTTRSSVLPVTLRVAEIAVNDGAAVTVKAWVKKDHATNIQAKLYVDGVSLSGVSETSDTKSDDTSWEELTITFTPTEKGVISAFLDMWCTSTTSANAYLGTVTITQA